MPWGPGCSASGHGLSLLLGLSDFIIIVTLVVSLREFHSVACGWQKGGSPILGRARISSKYWKLHGTASSYIHRVLPCFQGHATALDLKLVSIFSLHRHSVSRVFGGHCCVDRYILFGPFLCFVPSSVNPGLYLCVCCPVHLRYHWQKHVDLELKEKVKGFVILKSDSSKLIN